MELSQITEILMPILQAIGVFVGGYILKKAPEFTKKHMDNLQAKTNNEYWRRFLQVCETIVLAVEQSVIEPYKKAAADKEITKEEWEEIYKIARETAGKEIVKAIESILPDELKDIARELLPSLIESSVAKVKLSKGGVSINPL